MGINARDPYELVTGAVDTAMRINQSSINYNVPISINKNSESGARELQCLS